MVTLDGAGFYEKQVAGKMQRNRFLAEQRVRLLDAVRQTYSDFFTDSYVSAHQLHTLQACPCCLYQACCTA